MSHGSSERTAYMRNQLASVRAKHLRLERPFFGEYFIDVDLRAKLVQQGAQPNDASIPVNEHRMSSGVTLENDPRKHFHAMFQMVLVRKVERLVGPDGFKYPVATLPHQFKKLR